MSLDTPPPPPATRYYLSFEVDRVCREISFDDVRRYVVRKGFELRTHKDGSIPGDLYGFNGSTALIYDETASKSQIESADWLRSAVVDVAAALHRQLPDVLRELSGEVLTLADAKAALIVAYEAASGKSYDAPSGPGLDGASAYEVVIEMMELAELSRGVGAAWVAVAVAAEDLAALALDSVRSARRMRS